MIRRRSGQRHACVIDRRLGGERVENLVEGCRQLFRKGARL
jgi:hypothetical protein